MNRRISVMTVVLALALSVCAVAPTSAKEGSAPTYWEMVTIISTVIHDGRPAGLLTVVPVIDLGANKMDDMAMQKLVVQDRFLLGLNRFATTGFDPRMPINIMEIKRILQEELDKVWGPGHGTVLITSAHIAQRKG